MKAEDDYGDDEPVEEEVEAQSEEGDDLFDENEQMQLEYDDEIRNEDIDFLEKYCLSKDRLQATARAFDSDAFEYWYWSLLNAQVRKDPKEWEDWEKNVAEEDFYNVLDIQQLILRQEVMDCTPETIEDVQSKLHDVIENVNLDHEVDGTVGAKDEKAFPTELQVRTNDLLNRNFTKVQNGEDSIQNIFTSASGLWLADKIERKGLTVSQMGDLLDLMEDEPPKIPFLLTALQADFKEGTLFGERKLHAKLTCETMMRLADKMPNLFEQEAFAVACLQKLRDVSDVSLLDDREKLGEYYKKMLKFVKSKNIPHVSLQALVIFNYMRFQEEEGAGYDENLVKEYLALPRRGNIYKPLPKPKKKKRRNEKVVEYKEPEGDQTQVLETSFTVESIPELKPIAYEELYIQRALSDFFLNKRKVENFENVLAKSYAVPLRAEVMLMAGRGSEKARDEMITQIKKARGPGAYKSLKERVDLEFVPSSRKVYSVEDGIYMEILSKNNPSIDVNVYRVNAKNYYKTMQKEIPDDITLSGSMPIVSYNISSEDVKSIKKVKHEINIPQLEGERGVFAVDITGNGVYLRVLIRKGELRYIADQDSNSNRGHVFKVFNEKNELVKDPCIWMDGEEYYADENGDVCLPFCEGESRAQLIILEDATSTGTATLQQFQRMAPKYKLECGMYIDREQLRNKEEASVLIRANLYFNTEIISLSRLENVQFKLVCEDNMGKIRTRISSLDLLDDQETVYQFTVPTELRYVECILTCRCEGIDLVSKQLLNVNTLNDTMAMGDMYLYPSGGAGYVLAVFGKNGEVFPGQAIDLQFTHRFLRDPVKRTVQTDENGLVYLGKLYDVTQIDATSVADSTTFSDKVYSEQSFDVLKDMVNLPQVVNRNLGDVVRIPFIADNPRKPPSIYVYDKDYISDFSANAKYEGYYITIEGLPAGDFVCHIRDVQNADVDICISTGLTLDTGLGSYVISENRVLGISEDMPLNIVDVIGNRKEGYTVKLQGVNELTRVHLVAVVNVPAFNLFGFLSSPNAPPTHIDFEQPVSAYLPATALDSEYNYIINRKSSPQSVGNLLPRPTLANHLWSAQNSPIRTKDPKKYVADLEVISKMKSKWQSGLDNFGLTAKRKEGDSTSLEFLGVSSKVIFNIRPEVDGDVATISIPKEFYSHEHNLVQVLAVDDDNTALRNVILEEHVDPIQRTDVRLNPGLDSSKHYAETRKVVCLRSPGDEYIIQDFSTAEYEPYEALDEPYNLYRAVGTKRETLVQFEPLVHWHEISDEEKLEFYDCYACNEVNLFMYNKDRDFFDKVCAPVISNKTQKTFMDDYVLGAKLKKYTALHRFSKLNVLEKILLCSVIGDADFSAKTLAWIQEKAELTDVNPRNMDKLFNMGIDSRQLGVEELDKQMLKAEQSARSMNQLGSGETELVEKITSLDAIRKSGIFGGSEEYMSMTRQYAETTYYGYDSQSQTAELISPNRFWADYGSFLLEKLPGGFVSEWFQIATGTLNEMLLSLAVLDVPLFAEAPEKQVLGNGVVKLVATNPVILYLRELIETERTTSAVNVSTNYFDPTQIKHVVDGEMQDKFIKQFTTGRVFGCSVVITNVSSVPMQVEVLCQVPTGSIPCGVQCFQTQCYLQDLPPFGTYCREFYFYWPSPGTFSHFPPHVNKNGKTIGSGGGLDKIEVTVEEVEKDTTSWKYISNIAEDAVVLDFLANSPQAADVGLERICWRCKEPGFFMKAVNILRERRIYNDQIWAYSLVSDQDGKALGEYLSKNQEFRDYCGPALSGNLTTIDLGAVRVWQVMEFWPLLNPRTHSFDMDYSDFKLYYYNFLELIAFTSASVQEISVKDKLVFASYLLVRNKVDEAKKLFDGIKPEEAAAHQIIYDYFDVYFAYMMNDTGKAGKISESYVARNMPNFMKQKFQDVLDAIAESNDPTLSDAIFLEEEERLRQEQMKPYVNFEVSEGKINMEYRNIEGATVNFYKTELEVLFSAHPFQESNTGYKLVQPNDSIALMDLDPKASSKEIPLPDDYRGSNTIIQIITDTLEVVDLYNDHELDVQLAEDEGELRVVDLRNGRPLEGAYCKVYGQSRINPEEAEFFKDGYTDLRGRFDYRALSTDQLRQVSKLSILIQTEERGSLIKECDVPSSVPLP